LTRKQILCLTVSPSGPMLHLQHLVLHLTLRSLLFTEGSTAHNTLDTLSWLNAVEYGGNFYWVCARDGLRLCGAPGWNLEMGPTVACAENFHGGVHSEAYGGYLFVVCDLCDVKIW